MLNLSLGLSLGSLATQRRGGWSPLDLGSKLIAWWDASHGVTLSGNQVTAWTDRKSGHSLTQATSSARPTWSATSFNGAPGLTFDGSDDELTGTGAGLLAALPSGSSPSELWGVVQQDAPGSDAGVRHLGGYGGVGALDRRILTRSQSPGPVSTGGLQFGDGSANRVAGMPDSASLQSRHVMRGVYLSTGGTYHQDGSIGNTVAATPATTASRLRIGGSTQAVANLLWQGKVRDYMVTLPLTSDEAAKLLAFLLPRRAL